MAMTIDPDRKFVSVAELSGLANVKMRHILPAFTSTGSDPTINQELSLRELAVALTSASRLIPIEPPRDRWARMQARLKTLCNDARAGAVPVSQYAGLCAALRLIESFAHEVPECLTNLNENGSSGGESAANSRTGSESVESSASGCNHSESAKAQSETKVPDSDIYEMSTRGHNEMVCLICRRQGHLTTDHYGTVGLNTKADRELMRITELANKNSRLSPLSLEEQDDVLNDPATLLSLYIHSQIRETKALDDITHEQVVQMNERRQFFRDRALFIMSVDPEAWPKEVHAAWAHENPSRLTRLDVVAMPYSGDLSGSQQPSHLAERKHMLRLVNMWSRSGKSILFRPTSGMGCIFKIVVETYDRVAIETDVGTYPLTLEFMLSTVTYEAQVAGNTVLVVETATMPISSVINALRKLYD